MPKIALSTYLTKQAETTIKLIVEKGLEKEPVIGEEKNFFVSVKKEPDCLAEIKYLNKKFYLHQKF